MSFIVTAAGDELSLYKPNALHITAYSVAWSLSQINRFTGHCLRPYSVAEHSLLVCDIAERVCGLDIHGQLAALLHDAHEAITGDMHTPGKSFIGSGWAAWEIAWEYRVRTAFGTLTSSATHATAIKLADRVALATEKRDLLPKTPTPWPQLQGVDPADWINLYSTERRAMSWEDWRDRFLDRFHELDFARTEALFGADQAEASTEAN